MNLEDIRLSEISKSQKDKCCVIPPVGGMQSSQTHRGRKYKCDCQEIGRGGRECTLFLNEYSSNFARWEKEFWTLHNNVNILNTIELYT